MKRPAHLRRLMLWLSTGGLLLANGCLAALERNVDRVLAPAALENTITLPNSPVADLALLFSRLLQG